MIVIKQLSDLSHLDLPSSHLQLLQDRFHHLLMAYGTEYDPDNDGYIVYLEPGEDRLPIKLPEVNALLKDMPFEGVLHHSAQRCYEAILVTNNSFALSFIIPDSNITEETRQHLLANL